MVRTKQGGSILEFVIVGIVMALLLVGGAYFVRHKLLSASTASEPLSSQDNKDKPSEPSDEDSGSTEGKENQPDPSESTEDKGKEEQPSTSEPAEQPQAESEAPSDLPHTGPAGAVFSSVLLGGMVAAASAYKRSRDLSASL